MRACCARCTRRASASIWSPARGIGTLGAMFAAVDGGQRLWDRDGLWKHASVSRAYRLARAAARRRLGSGRRGRAAGAAAGAVRAWRHGGVHRGPAVPRDADDGVARGHRRLRPRARRAVRADGAADHRPAADRLLPARGRRRARRADSAISLWRAPARRRVRQGDVVAAVRSAAVDRASSSNAPSASCGT